jgi:hypothetical protein
MVIYTLTVTKFDSAPSSSAGRRKQFFGSAGAKISRKEAGQIDNRHNEVYHSGKVDLPQNDRGTALVNSPSYQSRYHRYQRIGGEPM